MSIILRWCKGEGLDPEHVIGVSNIPEGAEAEDIEKTLATVKVLGRIKVRMKFFEPATGHFIAYCECKQRVNTDTIPPEVVPVKGGQPWPICGIRSAPDPDQPGSEEPSTSTDSLIKAMGEFFRKSMRPAQDGNAFKRLQAFSGIVPTPAGEESLDNWWEQAHLMVEVCDCSDKEKRKRIIESLRGPAFEIARAVRSTDPDASPHNYLDAMEREFGCSDSGKSCTLF